MQARDSEAAALGLVLLDEFKFPHAVFPISPSEMSIDGLKYAYGKIAGFLDLKVNQDAGLTVVVAPQFMFVSLIGQPYHTEGRPVLLDFEYSEDCEATAEVALYLDGFAYSGIVNLQDIDQKWPATAGRDVKSYQAMEAITRQSTVDQH